MLACRTTCIHSPQYRKEGIQWEPIEYFNNKIICDMVEEKHKGVVAILVCSTLSAFSMIVLVLRR